jgi:hypothetical protein
MLLKKYLLTLLIVLLLQNAIAQNVGINATGAAPNASAILDVEATDKGFLIPRVALTQTSSNAPIGASIITSLLVYNTATINDVTPGFYYWNGSIWIRFQSNLDIDHDWYEIGTTTAPNAITDSMFHTGDVAIGKNTIGDASLDIANTTNASSIELTNTATLANNYGILSNMNNASNTNAFGIRTNFTTTGNGILAGVFTNMDINTLSGTASHYGARNILYGNGPIYGTHNVITGNLGSGNTQYGTYTEMYNSSVSAPSYGTRNDMRFSSCIAKYGTSNFIQRGLINIGTENVLGMGGTSYGTHNIISGFADYGYGSYTRIDMLQGEAYGTKNVFTGSSLGAKYGTYDSLATTSSGIQYGKYTDLTGAGTGQQFGNYTTINNSGNATHYGTNNFLSGTGTGTKYASYDTIPTSAGGNGFANMSIALDTLNDYAGFFRGKLSVGMDYTNNYVLPTTRGTNNQIMITDATGKVSWQNASTVAGDHDWYKQGTSTAPTSINDSMYHIGNTAIGKNTANYPLDIIGQNVSRTIILLQMEL